MSGKGTYLVEAKKAGFVRKVPSLDVTLSICLANVCLADRLSPREHGDVPVIPMLMLIPPECVCIDLTHKNPFLIVSLLLKSLCS